MAFCFGCHGRAARVVRTEPAWVDGHPEVWRLVDCPAPPLGCGERRKQRIVDDGPLVNRRNLPETVVTRPKGLVAKIRRTARSGEAVGST